MDSTIWAAIIQTAGTLGAGLLLLQRYKSYAKKRDEEIALNKRKDVIVGILLEAYYKLSHASNRDTNEQNHQALHREIEIALDKLCLVADSELLKLINDFGESLSRNNGASTLEILDNIQVRLRRELFLDSSNGKPRPNEANLSGKIWVRFSWKGKQSVENPFK